MNHKQLFLVSVREIPFVQPRKQTNLARRFFSQAGISFLKEPGKSMGTAAVIRTILLVDIVALALFALIYLRQRRMSLAAFLCWGVLAMFVPVLGPFLVISQRPGEWNPTFSFGDDFKRLVQLARRVLPEQPPASKMSRLDRARRRKQRKQP